MKFVKHRLRWAEIAEPRIKLVATLKHVALQLCTCTWIEIMTGAGVALYLSYLGNHVLAAITVGVFAPLIIFHFAMTRLPKSNVKWQQPRHRVIKLRV